MVRHIYGYENVLSDDRRPHLFINELKLYVDYFKNEIRGILRRNHQISGEKVGKFSKIC
jgi:hypothetical protein